MISLTNLTQQGRSCSGWILYTQKESVRNRHAVDLYRAACDKYGMSLKLGIYEPPKLWEKTNRLPGSGRLDFVVNRTRDYRLAAALEQAGVRVYNHSRIAELGNDKAKACRWMESRGIPMMPSVYGVDAPPPWYPAVVKSCGGHGGTEVFFIKDGNAWQAWKHDTYEPGKNYMMQQAASDLGRDVRVYIVGNQIAACVLRSCDRDFRSNFCLGGTAQLYELNETERSLVERTASMFPIGMAGIDFIFHHGRMVFNEIEDMAGARSLYSLTDYDIIDAYVSFIRKDSAGEYFF